MKISQDLVLKVNEVYHDVEGREYENKHPEIFTEESLRWKKIGREFFKDNKGITLMDFGTGTGFVVEQIGEYFNSDDRIICSDLSAEMLKIAEQNIKNKGFSGRYEFLKFAGNKIDLPDNSLDYITLNSVLHHLPDIGGFFDEAGRLLKSGGRLAIGHEPNNLFYKNGYLHFNLIFCSLLCAPKQVAKTIVKKIGMYKVLKRFFGKNKNSHEIIIDTVNSLLVKDGIIKEPLSSDEITDIVDFHVSAGLESSAEKGFDINQISEKYLPNFKLEFFESYQHIKDLSFSNNWLRWYDKKLAGLFPASGSNFFVVFKKNG